MTRRKPSIPEYKVYKKAEKPYPIGPLGQTGLAQLIAIEPAFDIPEGFFGTATIAGSTQIRPMHKIADSVMLLEVSALGQGPDAEEDIDKTIAAIGYIANAWQRPEDYLTMLYSQRPEHAPLEKSRVTAKAPDLPL